MFYFNKEINSLRIKAKPGMPVPRKYQAPSCLRSIRETYGADAIVEILGVYDHPEHWADFFKMGTPEENVQRLEALCREQTDTIKRLTEENKQLRAKVKQREQ